MNRQMLTYVTCIVFDTDHIDVVQFFICCGKLHYNNNMQLV